MYTQGSQFFSVGAFFFLYVYIHVRDEECKAKTYVQSSQLLSEKKVTALGGIPSHDVLRSRKVLYLYMLMASWEVRA